MNRHDFDALKQRIRDRAALLWEQHGKPEGPRDRLLEEARELVAIEENPVSGRIDPSETAEPVIEDAALMRNLGEFPTLTDQGNEQTFPDGDEIHLSDDDASDQGGVLPPDDLPDETFADVASDDADVVAPTFGTDPDTASEGGKPGDRGFADEPDGADRHDDDLDDDETIEDAELADDDDGDDLTSRPVRGRRNLSP